MRAWLLRLLPVPLVVVLVGGCGGASSTGSAGANASPTDSAGAYFHAMAPIERGYRTNAPVVAHAIAEVHAALAGDWTGPARQVRAAQTRMNLLAARAAAIQPPPTLRFSHRDYVAGLRSLAQYDADLYRALSQPPESATLSKRSLDVLVACQSTNTGALMSVSFHRAEFRSSVLVNAPPGSIPKWVKQIPITDQGVNSQAAAICDW
jgi:hypothetical protein